MCQIESIWRIINLYMLYVYVSIQYIYIAARQNATWIDGNGNRYIVCYDKKKNKTHKKMKKKK